MFGLTPGSSDSAFQGLSICRVQRDCMCFAGPQGDVTQHKNGFVTVRERASLRPKGLKSLGVFIPALNYIKY